MSFPTPTPGRRRRRSEPNDERTLADPTDSPSPSDEENHSSSLPPPSPFSILRLRVRPRRRPGGSRDHHCACDASTLFVRLSSRTARKLHSIAAASAAAAVAVADGNCLEENTQDKSEYVYEGRKCNGVGGSRDGSRCSESRGNFGGWKVRTGETDAGNCRSGVEFLPLAISVASNLDLHRRPTERRYVGSDTAEERFGSANVVYASYNGGDIESIEGHDYDEESDEIIEIHPSLLAALSQTPPSNGSTAEEGATPSPVFVDVRPLPAIGDAASVTVEPLTFEDWEAIEVNSEFLEAGGLLSQISVVYPGLSIRVDLGAGDHARVLVREDGFVSGGTVGAASRAENGVHGRNREEKRSEGEDPWSDDGSWSCSGSDYSDQINLNPDRSVRYGGYDDYGSSDDNLPVRSSPDEWIDCLRLVADTEVIVVPKPRPERLEDEEVTYDPSAPLRVHPSASDFTPGFRSLVDGLASSISLRGGRSAAVPSSPPPFTVHVHPDCLAEMVPGWDICTDGCNLDAENSEGNSFVISVLWKSSRFCGPNGESARHDEALGDENGLGMVAVRACEEVPYGHIVLHKHVRYQLSLNLLYDHVRLRLIHPLQAERDARRTEEKIRNGSLRVRFQPTTMRQSLCSQDGGRMWRYPQRYRHECPQLEAENAECGPPIVLSSISQDGEQLRALEGPLISGALIFQPFTAGAAMMHTLIYQPITSGSSNEVDGEGVYGEIPAQGPKRFHGTPDFIFWGDLHSILGLVTFGTSSSLDFKSHNIRKEPTRSAAMPDLESFTNIAPRISISSDGLIDAISFADSHISSALSSLSHKRPRHARFPDGLLVVGEEGTGKTHLMVVVAAYKRIFASCSTVYLDCKRLQASSNVHMRDILDEIAGSFCDAVRSQPCLLLLDGLDALVPNVEASGDEEDGSVHHIANNSAAVGQVKVIADHIRFLMETSAREVTYHRNPNARANDLLVPAGVSIVASCQSPHSISPLLRRTGLFSSIVEVPNMTSTLRAQLFDSLVSHDVGSVCAVLPSFGKRTESYRPIDIEALASRVRKECHLSSIGRADYYGRGVAPRKNARAAITPASLDSLEKIMNGYVPIAHRGANIEVESDSSRWSAVGGLFDAKQALVDIILHPVRHSRFYRNSPISLPRGILLYGPPGCGKTFLVPALARECNFNLVTCRGPEILDKYIGASEAKVRQLFARTYAAAPAILFLDDFDALAPRRGTDHTGVTDRVVNQLLTFLDGVEDAGKKSGMVYIIAATSRPDKIDPALLRPGRLEKHIFLGYPRDEAEWTDTFSAVSQGTQLVDANTQELISSGKLLENVRNEESLAHIKSFSAADMKSALDTAYLNAVHEHLSSAHGRNIRTSVSPPLINDKHLLDALGNTRPSLLPKDREYSRRIFTPFYAGGSVGEISAVVPLGDFEHEGKKGARSSLTSVPSSQGIVQTLKTTLR